MDRNFTPMIDKDTMRQFEILTQIDALLRPVGINFWLRGGWAIDFLLGYLTRSHSDIDIVVWNCDASQLRNFFEKAGFLFIRDTGVQFDFSKSGQEVSIIFIAKNEEEVFVENIPDWIWLPEALTFPPQQLQGLLCNVISPEQLLEEKEGYQRGTGRPQRPKDLKSVEVLREYIMS